MKHAKPRSVAERLSKAASAAAILIAVACTDASRSPTAAPDRPQSPVTATTFVFACTGGSAGVRCLPATGSAATSLSSGPLSPVFDKIVGSPYVRLSQTAFDFGVSGTNQLRSTIAVQNLTVLPFATNSDYITFDGVGPKVFFTSGPSNTGGAPGAVTLVNADGIGTFTTTNQSFYNYQEQIPANAANLVAKQWIFQLPDPTTTFAFQVYVNVKLPDESSFDPPPHTFYTVESGPMSDVSCARRHEGATNSNFAGYCWGNNADGQLGEGTTTNRPVPIGVLGVGHGMLGFTAGAHHTCGVSQSPIGLYCWGLNASGQLGDGTTTPRKAPQLVPLPSGVGSWQGMAAGSNFTCAIAATPAAGPTRNTAVYCWGSNEFGQLGNSTNVGTTAANPTPLLVALPSGVTDLYDVTAGDSFACVNSNTPAAKQPYCWGNNRYGQLSTTVNNGTDTPTGAQLVAFPSNVSGFTTITAGANHTCALSNQIVGNKNPIYCWGENLYGELGSNTNVGTTTATPTPQMVSPPTGENFTAFGVGAHHVCAPTGQAVYCWGSNQYGQLGTTANIGTSNPNPTLQTVSIGLASVNSAPAAGVGHTCVIRTDHTAACWGKNDAGQLGTGTFDSSPHSTPLAVVMP